MFSIVLDSWCSVRSHLNHNAREINCKTIVKYIIEKYTNTQKRSERKAISTRRNLRRVRGQACCLGYLVQRTHIHMECGGKLNNSGVNKSSE